ncbi:hypothetical protein GS429_09435 [Natronorubrum sp. JWXQ-INN-674]|uniref:Halobacterial output domain-containing protein n=1 Tax=Natronorubrum halalkaliphilum TaxID=2691917 RepID=A0A6B0VL34_9EURY|nr:HalOD1 output domain-containing protein [Natronorubrum halalkaliphilum]MXV62280.1 hypothetical protein [Natronorubrum halalkaliphilum]
MSQERPISFEVAQQVADREGVPVEELRPPLHTAIDTDALDSLFRSNDPDRRPTIEFRYNGHTVRIDSTGEITVGSAPAVTEPERQTV